MMRRSSSQKATKVVTVIPEKLLWAPNASPEEWGKGTELGEPMLALDLCSYGTGASYCNAGTYRVQHYTQQALGRSFGPLGLDSLARFCRGLKVSLANLKEGEGPLVLWAPPGEEAYRMNSAVLLGAYLLLCSGWSASQVVACLGASEAGGKFPCAWARMEQAEPTRELSVRDCWLGVEAARNLGWIDKSFIEDDATMREVCKEYTGQIVRYDAVWIVSGKIMVGADPTTALLDPNPATLDKIFPAKKVEPMVNSVYKPTHPAPGSIVCLDPFERPPSPSPCTDTDSTAFTSSPPDASDSIDRSPRCPDFARMISPGVRTSCAGSRAPTPKSRATSPARCIDFARMTSPGGKQDFSRRVSPLDSPRGDPFTGQVSPAFVRMVSRGSCETVCKEYEQCEIGKEALDSLTDRRDFVTLVKDSGIGMVVRANFDGEPGMMTDSYDGDAFLPYGLQQKDIQILDVKGGLPLPSDVAEMIDTCHDYANTQGRDAVFVHCKGGFGRSVVLACCLAITRFDVPGSALLGWVRIVRPGAITCRQQELFLKSLKGKKDVLRYAKIEGESGSGVRVSCSMPCQVQ